MSLLTASFIELACDEVMSIEPPGAVRTPCVDTARQPGLEQDPW